MDFKRAFFSTFFAALLLGGAFAGGYLVRDRLVPETGEKFPLLLQAYGILRDHGLENLPEAPTLEYGMIRGMVQAYADPYTQFVEPAQHELDSNALQGSYGGIGARLEVDGDGYILLYPYPDSPAAKAGVREADRLLAVGERQVIPGTTVETVQSAIRGPVGEAVVLTVGHNPDYRPVQVRIPRAEIALPSVTWRLAPDEPRLGVVEINLIAASTGAEIQTAVEALQSRGATHFALDLRNNPGGLLTAGVDIARLFLQEGPVLEQQYRGQEVETFRVEKPGPLTDIPLAVLVNHSSASAAEIVAGALKVQARAVVVGEPTFGKDSIQLVFDLDDGSSLHVTAARWWVPGLEPALGGSGVQPDVRVENAGNSEGPDLVLEAAAKALLEPQVTNR